MKYLDIVVMFLFVLWAAATDFTAMGLKDWLAGAILMGYMVYYAIKMGRQKAEQKKASQK